MTDPEARETHESASSVPPLSPGSDRADSTESEETASEPEVANRDANKTAASLRRRGFLQRLGSWFMGLGLLSGYGTFAAYIVRYLLPTKGIPREWQFVTTLDRFPSAGTLSYRSPVGENIVIARLTKKKGAEEFIALSSVCPHLGCQVHWEGHNNRFFCPCHNGVFDPQGQPVAGPPKEGNQPLPRYPVKIENGLLFIEVETRSPLESSA